MKISRASTIFVALIMLGGCTDEAVTDSDAEHLIGLHLFNGWTAEVPISSDVRWISFENWNGKDWERLYTASVLPGTTPIPLPVHMIPGVTFEREIIYAVAGFRGAFRIPDGVDGEIVWNGVEEISPGCFQILALQSDEGLVPCVRIKTLTES